MFKKSVEVKSQQRLSGADRKKLKRTIKERFPNASDSDLDILIPPKKMAAMIIELLKTYIKPEKWTVPEPTTALATFGCSQKH